MFLPKATGAALVMVLLKRPGARVKR
jgi:hypothetical protein